MERQGKLHRVLLEKVLAQQLKRLNGFIQRAAVAFTDQNITAGSSPARSAVRRLGADQREGL